MFQLVFCKNPMKDKGKKYKRALCLFSPFILVHKFYKTNIEISTKLIILRYTQVSTCFFPENVLLHKKSMISFKKVEMI